MVQFDVSGREGRIISTVVILAGGESRRMKRDKLALPFGSASLLASAVTRFSKHFDKVYISVADETKYPEIDAPRFVDIYKHCGPMGGIHAALSQTDEDGVFLVAADLPYADPMAAKRIIELAGSSDICILADSHLRYEPLFGYYKKTILPYVVSALQAGDYKIAGLFDKVNMRIVAKSELGDLWSEKLLLNINFPEDYERLLSEK